MPLRSLGRFLCPSPAAAALSAATSASSSASASPSASSSLSDGSSSLGYSAASGWPVMVHNRNRMGQPWHGCPRSMQTKKRTAHSHARRCCRCHVPLALAHASAFELPVPAIVAGVPTCGRPVGGAGPWQPHHLPPLGGQLRHDVPLQSPQHDLLQTTNTARCCGRPAHRGGSAALAPIRNITSVHTPSHECSLADIDTSNSSDSTTQKQHCLMAAPA